MVGWLFWLPNIIQYLLFSMCFLKRDISKQYMSVLVDKFLAVLNLTISIWDNSCGNPHQNASQCFRFSLWIQRKHRSVNQRHQRGPRDPENCSVLGGKDGRKPIDDYPPIKTFISVDFQLLHFSVSDQQAFFACEASVRRRRKITRRRSSWIDSSLTSYGNLSWGLAQDHPMRSDSKR